MEIKTKELDFLSGGGEMGERIRNFDWSKNSLGPATNWPRSLKTCVRIMLTSPQPIWIGWGKELIKLYNDAYQSILGEKHPSALGQPASVVWNDIWSDIEPMLSKVMNKNEGTYAEGQLLIMERYGYKEETYYTFSYSPVPGDNGVTEGMICFNTAETEGVLNERVLKTLRDLSNKINDCRTTEDVFLKASEAIRDNLYDFPFSMFYRFDENEARLLSCAGIDTNHSICPSLIAFRANGAPWVCDRLVKTGKPELNTLEYPSIPTGAWEISPQKAILFPIFTEGDKTPTHVFIAGLNPYRKYDDRFEGFVKLICEQISQAVNNVEAFESERRRAKALEELDRSKTVFFSNISHEFRTPITLMLGPLEELLNKSNQNFSEAEMESIQTTHRNAMRLLKLVNGLLDFSKVESGRMQARYVPTDVSTFTKSLGSNFHSLMEKGGLKFSINVQETGQPLYLDKQMWEKIIFNLLSNAFKYTLKGEVQMSVFTGEKNAVIKVKDTGIGIPQQELPKMFDRFHRVESIVGRTHEGTGIGLSMVKELVQLHGGTINVESKEGVGTTFTVTVPFGKDHLPEEKVFDSETEFTESVSESFIQEASSLIDNKQKEKTFAASPQKSTVVITDDNADMRNYISSLLKPYYNVVPAENGLVALHKIHEHKPSLVLSDIMMPVMDGIELTKKLKHNPETAAIPLILITARAGEESKLEGFEYGADDYLVKPFSARELVSRISAHLQMSAIRKNAQEATESERQRLYQVFMQAPAVIAILRGPDHIFELANPLYMDLIGSHRQVIGRPVSAALPEAAEQGFIELLDQVYTSGKPFSATELPVELNREGNGKYERRYLNFVYQPYLNERNEVQGILVHAIDVSDQVLSRRKIEDSEMLFRTLAETLPQMIWIRGVDGKIEYASKDWESYSGIKDVSKAWKEMMHPDDAQKIMKKWDEHERDGLPFSYEIRLKNINGEYRWHHAVAEPLKDEAGKIIRWIGAINDIHAQKAFTESLELEVKHRTQELTRSNEDLQQFAHVASHDLKEPVRKVKTFLNILQAEYLDALDEKGKMYVNRIQGAIDRVKAMIEGVLKYSEVDSINEVFEEVELSQIIENVENDLEMPIAAKEARLIYGTLPKIKGVKILIHQLFYNLINNSLKFSKRDETPVIYITSKIIICNGKNHVQIQIQDNGIGFDESKKEIIFGTFKRLNSKDDYEGTGLGLSLCKKIVERHGGEITATGAINKGAEFKILLPLI